MAKARTEFECDECGSRYAQWLGRCTGCGAWDAIRERVPEAQAPAAAPGFQWEEAGEVRALHEVSESAATRISSGEAELDRVTGGGLVPGSVVLLGGEPGIGKSTLSLQLARGFEASGRRVFYVSAEESLEQLRLRADRLDALGDGLFALAETRVEALEKPWRELSPGLVVVDSIQTMRSERANSAPGSVAQVRESAALLASAAKSQGSVLLLVGHVTKDGSLAGPRVLEHLVDVVLLFEGDRGQGFRMLRAVKNRFGGTQELGVFNMTATGLEGVANPSAHFLSDRRAGAPGTAVVPLLEGTRPLLVEVQALVAPAGYGTARRTCVGVDDTRVALLLAVLDRGTNLDFVSRDVYMNATGGVRIAEPAADLAMALSLASSRLDCAIPEDVAACGEVGLGGELRPVARLEARAAEAARLGFRRMLVPEAAAGRAAKRLGELRLLPFARLADAVTWLSEQRVN
ncbi:MAG: DNA repair protein RadA [Myxococcales bacterium]|nr:DNA repair protein RadA [Myxococcales bacterium]